MTTEPLRTRWSWTRLRLRTLLLLPLVCGLILALGGLREARWVGSSELTLRWLVVDAATGRPLSQATIEIFDQDGEHQSPLKVIATDFAGRARAVERCVASGRASLLRTSGRVRLPFWDFRISRRGYETSKTTSLPEQTGTWALDLQDPTLPTMRVELHRARPDPAGPGP